jgi:DNA polymerase (family 10)
VEELEAAAKQQRLRTLKGFGPKVEQNILRGIALLRRSQGRMLLGQAWELAQQVLARLRDYPHVRRLEYAGSLRRFRETVGDLDFLVISDRPESVIQAFTEMDLVEEVLAAGGTKGSVRLREGEMQADLRVVPAASFGAALQYFTGSKEHNVRLREIAIRKGLKLNEYGVFDSETEAKVAGVAEEEVYAALDLPWIPPPLREDRGEIQAALEGRLPTLVQWEDIRGDLHVHSDWSDGGYEYLLITDHSKSLGVASGLDEERLRQQREEIAALNRRRRGRRRRPFRILSGLEVDILADGTLDLDEAMLAELDLVVASVHSRLRMKPKEMTERLLRAIRSGWVDILAHPTGRLINEREGFEFDFERVLEACAEYEVALEINAFPQRLDLRDVHARAAKEQGVKVVISTDAHRPEHLDFMRFGVGTAQRGWLEPEDVLNTQPWEALLEWKQRRRRRAKRKRA